jgi:hypothetical protein
MSTSDERKPPGQATHRVLAPHRAVCRPELAVVAGKCHLRGRRPGRGGFPASGTGSGDDDGRDYMNETIEVLGFLTTIPGAVVFDFQQN